jgi:hypothetical protein
MIKEDHQNASSASEMEEELSLHDLEDEGSTSECKNCYKGRGLLPG